MRIAEQDSLAFPTLPATRRAIYASISNCWSSSKFINRNGRFTAYAFACGYVEQKRRGSDDVRLCKLDNMFAVIVTTEGWKYSPYYYDSIKRARKHFNLVSKGWSKVYE